MASPTNPTRHVRKLGTIPYVAGQRQTLELDKDGVLLSLALKCSFTVAAGATAPTSPLLKALSRIIRRVEVIAGGRDTVQSVPGYMLALRAYLENGRDAYGVDGDPVIAANGSRSYTIVLPVSFTLPLGRRSDDCGLDTLGINQLALSVTWGDISDLYGAPGTASLSNVALSVEGEYLINPARTNPYLVRTLDWQDVDVTANNTELGVTIDNRTGLVIASLLVVTHSDNIGTNAMLNSARLQAGSFVYQNRDAVLWRAETQRQLNVAPVDGVFYLEPRYDGQVTNTIRTDPSAMPADLKLICDVVKIGGVNRISVQREGIRALMQ